MQSSAEATRDPGCIGGRYRIESKLGRGGMAVVYQVLDTATGRRVALKRLESARSPDREDDIALFEREFLTLAQLVHPRVVTAYDYGVDELGPYYTMELLDGGDLQRVAPL
jgi:serine/threonine-protein kinase